MTKSNNVIDYSSLSPRLLAPILLTLIIGVALSFGAFFFGRSLEHDRTKAHFLQAAKTRTATLAGGIESKLHTLITIGSFYAASKEVGRLEFRRFVEAALSNHVGIQALEWIPRVLDNQRAAYEKAAQQDGLLDFQITERTSQGVVERAKQREEYFPVYFVEPLKGNEAAVGFDLASNATRLEALNRSRDTGKMLSTARITLVQEAGKQSGFLVFVPVYAKDVSLETVKDRRKHLKGFAMGVFRIGDMMISSLEHLGWGGIDVSLYDLDAPAGKRFLHAFHSHQAPEVDHRISKEVAYSSGIQHVETIDVAGRKWKILCEAEPAFVSSGKTWLPLGLFLSGLFITLLLTINLLSFAKRNISISKAYRELEQKTIERKQAVEALRESEEKYRTVFESSSDAIMLLDANGFIDCNDQALKMFGLTNKEEFIGINPSELSPPNQPDGEDSLTAANNRIAETFKDGYNKFEWLHLRKTGEEFTADVLLTSVELHGEQVLHAIVRDITEIDAYRSKMERIATEWTQFIDRANAPIFGVDTDGKIKEWNQVAARITGFSQEDVMGKDLVQEFIAEDYQVSVKDVLDQALSGTDTANFEFPLFSKDGKRLKVLLNATTRRDVKGDIIGVIGVGQDITEIDAYRDNLEGMVEERTAKLNKALTAADQAKEKVLESQRELTVRNRITDIFLTRSDTDMYSDVLDVILKFMESKYGFFGYINEDGDMVAPSLTREILDECQVPDKNILFPRRDWVAMWGQTLLEKKTLYANKGLHLPEGHVALARAMTVPILYQKELIGILAVAEKETDYDEKDREVLETISAHIAPILQARLQRDFEEKTRREAEIKLKASFLDTEQAKDKIDGILKSVADGLIVTDTSNRIVVKNRAAEDLLDDRLSEVIDHPIDYAIKEKTLRDKVRETLDKKTTGYLFDSELPGDDPKHPKIMRARTSVIHGKDGKQSGIVTIIHDVTHEREVDRMKTEFLSTAAHELRTPLTSIQGFSELLLTQKDLKEEEKEEFVSYINKQSVNLSTIVNDLLDISRLESGMSFLLNKEKCVIGDTIKQLTPYVQGMSSKHKLKVVLPEEPIELFVDKEKMEQVLKNLLSNAVKYSPDGGTVIFSAKKKRSAIEFSVGDQGIGMTPEQIDNVFEKFYRVDASTSAIEGTGLGMTIVKHIVEAHEGKIWMESELGKGTTVKFTIPI